MSRPRSPAPGTQLHAPGGAGGAGGYMDVPAGGAATSGYMDVPVGAEGGPSDGGYAEAGPGYMGGGLKLPCLLPQE